MVYLPEQDETTGAQYIAIQYRSDSFNSRNRMVDIAHGNADLEYLTCAPMQEESTPWRDSCGYNIL